MNQDAKVITLNGIDYVPVSSVQEKATDLDGMEYKIVRTTSAGVFAGYLKERKGKEAVIINARRLWYWVGAASLSQLAVQGTSRPEECKFPCEVSKIELTEVIEVLEVTETARKSIAGVKVWQA